MLKTLNNMSTTTKRIGTHSGSFHADEALAVYLLRMTPAFKHAPVTRSRNSEVLQQCDIIVDVEGKYDGTKHFDHHQRGFDHVFSDKFHTKLSSAGLIYKHFGKEIIAQRLGWSKEDPNVQLLFDRLYQKFIEGIDANDNGISAYPSNVKPKFESALSITGMVASLNPAWNVPTTDVEIDQRFEKASILMGEAFLTKLDFYGKSWLPARDIVVHALEDRKNLDSKGRILHLPQFCPWKEHLFDLEEEQGIVGQVLYILFPDNTPPAYRIQAMPLTTDSFENRKPLPAEWRGLRDEELSTKSGIPGCIFVHAAGFIGGNKTYEGALQMAQKALQM